MTAQAEPISLYDLTDLIFKDRAAASALIKQHPQLLEQKIPDSQETILNFLVIENYIAEVQFLLEHGANPDAMDAGGSTPLMHSCVLGYREMVALLLSHKAEVNRQDRVMNYTALHYAAQKGDTEIIQLLLAAGADKTIREELDGTPLDVAYKKYTILAELLK